MLGLRGPLCDGPKTDAEIYGMRRQIGTGIWLELPKRSGMNLFVFLYVLGGNAARFFLGVFSVTFPPILVFFHSSVRLRFFSRKVFRYELWNWCPEFFGDVFGP